MYKGYAKNSSSGYRRNVSHPCYNGTDNHYNSNIKAPISKKEQELMKLRAAEKLAEKANKNVKVIRRRRADR